jgi:hypothetical protein
MADTQTVTTTKTTNNTSKLDWSELEILFARHRSELERMRQELRALSDEMLPHLGESMWVRLVFNNVVAAADSMDVASCNTGSARRIAERRIETEGTNQ